MITKHFQTEIRQKGRKETTEGKCTPKNFQLQYETPFFKILSNLDVSNSKVMIVLFRKLGNIYCNSKLGYIDEKD